MMYIYKNKDYIYIYMTLYVYICKLKKCTIYNCCWYMKASLK